MLLLFMFHTLSLMKTLHTLLPALLLSSMALFLSACQTNASQSTMTTPSFALQRWYHWQCDTTTIQTRLNYTPPNTLSLRYQNQEYTLSRIAHQNRLIYENAVLAFYSDGKEALIGNSRSDKVLVGACQLRAH